MRSILVLGTVLATVAVAAADPPECRKWQGTLTVCEALGVGSGTNCTYVPVGIENETANKVLYTNSAITACRNLIKKSNPPTYNYNPSKTIKACTWSSTPGDKKCYPAQYGSFPWTHPTTVSCVYDSTGDGKVDWDDNSQLGLSVSLLTTQPDPHCFCTANGPHPANLSWSGNIGPWEGSQVIFGHAFPKELKQVILDRNYGLNNNTYKSEAILANSTTSFDPEPDLQKTDIYADDAAEVDHIIPRVDSKGCLCGDPTPNNAAVISRKLNASMLNVSPLYNQDRARMFAKYVTCPSNINPRFQSSGGRRVDMLADQQVDESSAYVESDRDQPPRAPLRAPYTEPAEPETGGCSTGGAAGLGLALAVLGLRLRRR